MSVDPRPASSDYRERASAINRNKMKLPATEVSAGWQLHVSRTALCTFSPIASRTGMLLRCIARDTDRTFPCHDDHSANYCERPRGIRRRPRRRVSCHSGTSPSSQTGARPVAPDERSRHADEVASV